jgi:hypothetical protein
VQARTVVVVPLTIPVMKEMGIAIEAANAKGIWCVAVIIAPLLKMMMIVAPNLKINIF